MNFLWFPFVTMYGFCAFLHRWFYEIGLRKRIRLTKPVVSVGNLTVGGTGKTAVIDHLLYDLESKGVKVCVLTRGYGRKSKETLIVDSTHSADDVGDEPLWLYQRHPQTKILVSQERAQAATTIKDVDLFLMDDGFQHHELKKDYEIVLLDTTRPTWHYRLLPQGYARESWDQLRRADIVVLTRANQAAEETIEELADKLFKLGIMDITLSSINFEHCQDILTQKEISIVGKKCLLVSGIANPESFEKLIVDSGGVVVHHVKEADHAIFSMDTISRYFEQAKQLQADQIVITEKDAVKWRSSLKESLSLPMNVGVCLTALSFEPPLEGVADAASHHFT
ncbi:MAG: tetraacyldisaccharide 4'-kinase [Oligoflexia bacterium]|nr:tetraacyldisaccharide 4'-kinase [Oligoflexia bacterium]